MRRVIREHVRQAVESAKERAAEEGDGSLATSVNIASVVSVGSSGQSTSVYSDGRVTIIRRDGETHIIHHGEEDETGKG